MFATSDEIRRPGFPAQAVADYVLEEAQTNQPEVVVGFDTRFLSDR